MFSSSGTQPVGVAVNPSLLVTMKSRGVWYSLTDVLYLAGDDLLGFVPGKIIIGADFPVVPPSWVSYR